MAQFMLIPTLILLFFWPLAYSVSLYFREGQADARKADEIRERLAFKAAHFYDHRMPERRILGMGPEVVYTTLVHLYLVLIFWYFLFALDLDSASGSVFFINTLAIIVKLIATPTWYLSEIQHLGPLYFPLIIIVQVAWSLLQAKLLVELYRWLNSSGRS